jgi:predicted nucleic acid-binding protein
MTVVVSDTSPLSYLIEINCEHLLPALYGSVLIEPFSKSSPTQARPRACAPGYPTVPRG